MNGKSFEGSAGNSFVIKAGEIHSLKTIGDSPLVQIDIHLSPLHSRESVKPNHDLCPEERSGQIWVQLGCNKTS